MYTALLSQVEAPKFKKHFGFQPMTRFSDKLSESLSDQAFSYGTNYIGFISLLHLN